MRAHASPASASSTCSACAGCATVRGAPPLKKLRVGLRPHADPDRLRLPRRPLLQPLRLPGAGAVHLPALRPARDRRRPTSSAPPPAASTSSVLSANAIWYVQVGALVVGHVARPDPRPRPRHRLLGRLPPGRPLPVLDAGGDGRLHLLRPLPALGGQRLSRCENAVGSRYRASTCDRCSRGRLTSVTGSEPSTCRRS